jgi:hypothetical protein
MKPLPKGTIMKNINSIKKFVLKHKVVFAVTSTAALLTIVNKIALRQHDNFLKEHGLYDEFYQGE